MADVALFVVLSSPFHTKKDQYINNRAISNSDVHLSDDYTTNRQATLI